MKLILKPHPNCKQYGEMIDIFTDEGGLPWGTVHIDAFYQDGDNTNIYHDLYFKKAVVTVKLKMVKE